MTIGVRDEPARDHVTGGSSVVGERRRRGCAGIRGSRSAGLVAAAAVAGVLLSACGGQVGAPPAPDSVPGTATGSGDDPFTGLVGLAVERINTADQVSAAKFGTAQPVDDPSREQQVLAAVAARAPGRGVDAGEAARFFRDQIEANKVVQRGLYESWSAQPERRPADRPDLTATVRPELDRLTDEIMSRLAATAPARHAGGRCAGRLARASTAAAGPLDQLHREALTVALRSVCHPLR